MKQLKKLRVGGVVVLSARPTKKEEKANNMEIPKDSEELKEEKEQKIQERLDKQNAAITKIGEMVASMNELIKFSFSGASSDIAELANNIVTDLSTLNTKIMSHISEETNESNNDGQNAK